MQEDDGVVQRLDDDVRFGFMSYQSDDGFEGAECPMLEIVAPAARNAAAIDDVFAPLTPFGDTPTGPAMLAAAELVGGEPSPTFLILATDGLPDTCELPDPDGHAAARADAIAATQEAYDGGAPTYVLSVGPDIAEDHLQNLANAGAGIEPGGSSTPYYVALNPDSLVSAFDSIMDGVRFCTYSFDDIEFAVREEGFVLIGARVALDGVELIEGVGWRLIGDDTVQLVGAACDAVLDGGDHEVTAELLCEMHIR